MKLRLFIIVKSPSVSQVYVKTRRKNTEPVSSLKAIKSDDTRKKPAQILGSEVFVIKWARLAEPVGLSVFG